MTLRDDALEEVQAVGNERLNRARAALVPVMTDHTGELVADPLTITEVVHTDAKAGVVIFHTTDGSNIYLGVRELNTGDHDVAVVTGSGTAWTVASPVLRSLVDLGRALSA